MKLTDIEMEILKIVENKLNNKTKVKTNDLLLDVGIDSVNIIELVIEIETKFDFEFEESMLSYNTLRSIDSISKYVYKRINEIQKKF